MSIKLKIGWEDDNVIIEGVRIYKSDNEFNTNTLPLQTVEITDGSLFYEDFDVIENETYFYMLSYFLGEREAFTECFEVFAGGNEIKVDFSAAIVEKLFTLPSSNLRARGFCKLESGNYLALIYDTSSKLIELNASGEIIKTYDLGSGDSYTCQFTNEGLSLHIFKTSAPYYRLFSLSVAYDINSATQITSSNSIFFANQALYSYISFATPRLVYAAGVLSGNHKMRKITLSNDYDLSSIVSNMDLGVFANLRALYFSPSGSTAIAIQSNWGDSKNTVQTFELITPFDLATATAKKIATVDKDGDMIFLSGGIITNIFSRNTFYFGDYLRDFKKITLT